MDRRFPEREDVVLPDLLERWALTEPGRTFAVFENGATWSYHDTASQAWSVANGFRALGVSQGGHVLSWLPTGPHAVLTWFGANAAGATYTPINPAFRGSLLQHVINLPKASVMVVHTDLVERLRELELPHLRTLVVVGEATDAPPGFTVVPWADVAQSGGGRPALERPIEPWDDMAIIYTSGTTGPSKGVRCTYLHHATFGDGLFPEELGKDDRFYMCLPMFHASSTNPIYTFLRRGGSLAITSGFNTATFWDDVRHYEATTGIIMAAMATFLYKQPPKPDDADHGMRLAYMGPMIDDVEGFSSRFGMRLYSTYNMTELPIQLRTPINPTKTKSCGRLLNDDWEVRIVDEFDRELPRGKVGELIARHTRPWTITPGYLGMPEATAEAWRNGWFHTGDALMCDEDGDFYFMDRIKDALRRRGENISSMEVEREILTHPEVMEAAVLGVPSDLKEDEVLALVVKKEGSSLEYRDLLDHLIPRLPYFMVPRYLCFVEGLPKTPSMKVRKVELRSGGLPADAWDREEHGVVLKREKLSQVEA